MRIRTRLMLALLVTAGAAFYLLGGRLRDDVKSRYFQVLEDGLSETSALLAATVESRSAMNGHLDVRDLSVAVKAALARNLDAEIFGTKKRELSLRVYATDAAGKVVYDSAGFGLGSDYSRWNDVYRTLRGVYGARSSRDDPRYPGVSIKYIAAPVKLNGKTIGVVTAGKPAISVEQVIANTKDKIAYTLAIVLLAFLLIGLAVTWLITRPLDLLIHYVQALRTGSRPALPKLGKSEIGALGREFELMRAELDGRKYVESYVQMLTHEFKTPVAGILGAAEILERDLNSTDRKKFLANIVSEAERIEAITEHLLQIATLENIREVPKPETIRLDELIEQLSEDFAAQCAQHQITLQRDVAPGLSIRGNFFLFYQALANLLQNAIDFSPYGSTVQISAVTGDGRLVIAVADHGAGIPDYASEKVFDKFYSLERPGTGRKSTGLGLALVKLIAELHGGQIELKNRASGHGTVARLKFRL